MLIGIHDSDGMHRGGVVELERISYCLVWPGPPHPHYRETMVDYSGHGQPSTPRSWLLLRMSKFPELAGHRDDGTLRDEASHALRLTAAEAVAWFERQGIDVPPDLLRMANCFRGRDASARGEASSKHMTEAGTLTDTQQRVWVALEGRRMIAKHLAVHVYRDVRKSDAVRKHIEAIRKTGRRIENTRMHGYWRPDAPPPELADSHELTVKPRPFRVVRATLVVPMRTNSRQKEELTC